jgi:hypothetical protein
MLLSKLVRTGGKPRFVILGKVFGSDLALACLAAAMLAIFYFTISRSVLALESSQNIFGRIP